jgi:hypothetical protein
MSRVLQRNRSDDKFTKERYGEFLNRRTEFRAYFRDSHPDIPYFIINISDLNPDQVFSKLIQHLEEINPAWAVFDPTPKEVFEDRLRVFESLVGPEKIRDFRTITEYGEVGSIEKAIVQQFIFNCSSQLSPQQKAPQIGTFIGTQLLGLTPANLSFLTNRHVVARKVVFLYDFCV